MKYAIYGKNVSEKYLSSIQFFFDELDRNNISVTIYSSFYQFLKENSIRFSQSITEFSFHSDLNGTDYLISIGGDGTFLETITLVRDSNIPILGINTGRLGFLSSVTTDEIAQAIKSLINGAYEIDKRTMLSIETENNLFGNDNFALNEITLQRSDSSTMITIHTYLDGEFLNSYWADGLIISTPTGSTAYSLSCNGPILFPSSESIILTPIAPHNLNVRPLIIPDNKVLSFQIEARTDSFLVALDSRFKSVPINTSFKIKKTPHTIRLVRLKNHTFLETLRNKLMWGIDKRN
ncbi:MAG: NAD kinase [Bacteroidetes bacterium HGW-Bacteroidetes-12]|nr:MAG: NAD kinase [Bacteroidetes bacterium HGW-Bacteroidetes-12]